MSRKRALFVPSWQHKHIVSLMPTWAHCSTAHPKRDTSSACSLIPAGWAVMSLHVYMACLGYELSARFLNFMKNRICI